MLEYRYGELSEKTLELLEDMGIYPIEEEFKGEERCFVIYFDETLPELIDESYISCKPVEETGWDEKWKDYIKPGFLTDTLRFEFDPSIEPDKDIILINPSMAFGTGTHPTTRCAARLLEKVCAGYTVADVGCGSGILALAALKRGAVRAYAFDNDPVALFNTYENIALNRAGNIYAWAGGIESFKGGAEIIITNIITSVLTVIHPYVLNLRPAYIVYSGILGSEYDEFIDSLKLEGYQVTDTAAIDEWRGVLFKCQ